MLISILMRILNFLKGKKKNQGRAKAKRIDTLTAFIRDFIHELFSVLTALQANVDLLQEDKSDDESSTKRFTVTNRSIDRLVRDTKALGDVLKMSNQPTKREYIRLDLLVNEIIQETLPEFSLKNTDLCSEIVSGTTLLGNYISLKKIITSLVLLVLELAQGANSIKIVGLSSETSNAVIIFEGEDTGDGEFAEWKLGQMKLIPTNGDSIIFSALDAMARLNFGNLSLRNFSKQSRTYRLSFDA